jgi:hypothetical protein
MNQRVKLIFIVIIAIFIFTTFIILNWDVGKEKKNLQEKKTMTGDQMTIAKELRIQKFNNCDLLSEVKIEKVEVNREKIGFLRFKFKKILTLQKVNIILNEYIEEGDKKDSEYLPIVESMDFLKTPQEYDIYGLTINELEILLRRKSGEEITITADQGELRYNGNYLRIIGNISISPAPKYIKKVEEILFPLKDIDNNKIVIKYIPALSQKHAKNEGLQKIKVMEDKIFLYEIITSKTKSEVKL